MSVNALRVDQPGNEKNQADNDPTQQGTARVTPLRPPSRWHDPLQLIQNEAPSHVGRIVLWAVACLFLILLIWALLGKLDIIATAEGKLVTQTLVKIVQPAEPGVIKELLVEEGEVVKAGQVLARLDTTLATADRNLIHGDLAIQRMQERRLEAELLNQPMLPKAGDDPELYGQVHSQYTAHRRAFQDGLAQERSLLLKTEHEKRSALQILAKLEQTLPTYKQSAEAYAKLQKDGFISHLAAAEKQREAIEKSRDLDAQYAVVAALDATIFAQSKKISQLQSVYKSELEKELADVRARIKQLQPSLDKSIYREGLMELRAPQDGVIKDLATTTIGAVVQPGTVVLTLVPQGEQLYADVNINNDDVGFVQVGQTAQVKLAAYPFQKYGMLTGKVVRISADATEAANSQRTANVNELDEEAKASLATYKARIQLDSQTLTDVNGNERALSPGMQAVAEINQGQRTVMEYLLSPVQKITKEAARER